MTILLSFFESYFFHNVKEAFYNLYCSFFHKLLYKKLCQCFLYFFKWTGYAYPVANFPQGTTLLHRQQASPLAPSCSPYISRLTTVCKFASQGCTLPLLQGRGRVRVRVGGGERSGDMIIFMVCFIFIFVFSFGFISSLDIYNLKLDGGV